MKKITKNISHISFRLSHVRKAFSVVEVMLAAALFSIFAVGGVALTVQGIEASRTAKEEAIATQFAAEGIEAVKSIKNQAYTNLATPSATGVIRVGGVWTWGGSNNTFDKYTRVINISSVQRDGSGNIVASGGTTDSDTKKVTSLVSWTVGPVRTTSVDLTTYLTNFRAGRGGMLVFANGDSTTDTIGYQVFDGTSWGSILAAADVDTGTTNKYLRAVRVLASATRNEKAMISRHYNGASQFIYAQVYNGTTQTWGNVQALSSWAATTFLSDQNFDGTYLANGDFMVVYSDNTNTPKYRTWNGSSWSSQGSLTSLGAAGEIPAFVGLQARPGTNEAMAVFFTQALDTISQYWSGSAWSAITSHATNAFNANNQEVDFAWSPNTTTTGMISYMTAGGDKTPRAKVFVANGSGGGSWGAQANGANYSQAVRTLMVVPRATANEFQVCTKDQQAAPNVECRKATFSGSTVTWATPTNPILTASSVNGTQQSFSLNYEYSSGDPGLNVFSDNTNVPKYKKYTASTSTWDVSSTSISTSPYTLGSPVQTVRLIDDIFSDNIMVLMADNNLGLYSVVWDGANDAMFTTPAGYAFTQHGITGSNIADLWFDFAWNK